MAYPYDFQTGAGNAPNRQVLYTNIREGDDNSAGAVIPVVEIGAGKRNWGGELNSNLCALAQRIVSLEKYVGKNGDKKETTTPTVPTLFKDDNNVDRSLSTGYLRSDGSTPTGYIPEDGDSVLTRLDNAEKQLAYLGRTMTRHGGIKWVSVGDKFTPSNMAINQSILLPEKYTVDGDILLVFIDGKAYTLGVGWSQGSPDVNGESNEIVLLANQVPANKALDIYCMVQGGTFSASHTHPAYASTAALAAYASQSWVNSRLESRVPAAGTNGHVLTLTNGSPSWAAVSALPSGGTSGQVLTMSGTPAAPTWTTFSALPTGGASGNVLTLNGSTPTWSTPASGLPSLTNTGDILGIVNSAATWSSIKSFLPAGGTSGQVLGLSSAVTPALEWKTIGTASSTVTSLSSAPGVGETTRISAGWVEDKFLRNDGNDSTTGVITAEGFNVSSDLRLKAVITPLADTSDLISKLEPVSFEYITTPGVKHYGFIAQHVKGLDPNLITTSSSGYLSIGQSEIIAILVKAVQELQKQVFKLID